MKLRILLTVAVLLGCNSKEQEQQLQDIALKQERLEKEIEATKSENQQLRKQQGSESGRNEGEGFVARTPASNAATPIPAPAPAATGPAPAPAPASQGSSHREARDFFVGQWDVSMECTSTSCSWNRVGNEFTETWYISEANGQINVRVVGNTVTNSQYEGEIVGDRLRLRHRRYDAKKGRTTTVRATIGQDGASGLWGNRVITAEEDNCQTEYRIAGSRRF
ncbi:MAG: hypothetical protein IT211_10550 [Armatimonadetes bacterium]|nr:hypothetical protein [Armatimonadota bacterium]